MAFENAQRVGGVEMGGTKIRVARGTAAGAIEECETFPTAGPEESLARIRAFFAAGPPVAAIGVGAFGPVGVNPDGAGFGRMGATPKPGWADFDLVGAMAATGAPIMLDTDVNAAGRGEAALGVLAGIGCGVYLTVGTGIGGGLILGGRPVNGAAHPEMGHVALVREADDNVPSVCSHHPSCAEGLASGPAIQRRFGVRLSQLRDDHPGIKLIAHYLGQLVANLTLTVAPHRIVIGGGVSKTPGLHRRVHDAALRALNGYALYPAIESPDFVVAPVLGEDSGLIGVLLMAGDAT